MLTDAEIKTVRSLKEYQNLLSTGSKGLITDLIKAGKGDFKPDLSFFVKAVNLFVKARIIRKELRLCCSRLLENILNRELQWSRVPESVRAICEADKENFLWMRFDGPRVETLFGRARDLITDAEYRDIIKSHSSLTGDKNTRLLEIAADLNQLLISTLRSIGTRGLYDQLVQFEAAEYYRRNEAAIQEKFLGASKERPFGLLPEDTNQKQP